LKQQRISSKDFVWMAASQLQRKLWFTGHNDLKQVIHEFSEDKLQDLLCY